MLIKYCKEGNIEKVKNYLLIKRNINIIDDTKTTSLMHASAIGNLEITKIDKSRLTT